MIFISFSFYLASFQSQSWSCKNAQNEQYTLASSKIGKEKRGSKHSITKTKWVGWCCFLFLLYQSLHLLALLPPVPDSIKSCCEYFHVYVLMDWSHNLKSSSVLPGLPWCQWHGPVTSKTQVNLYVFIVCCFLLLSVGSDAFIHITALVWPNRNFTSYVREAFFYRVLM